MSKRSHTDFAGSAGNEPNIDARTKRQHAVPSTKNTDELIDEVLGILPNFNRFHNVLKKLQKSRASGKHKEQPDYSRGLEYRLGEICKNLAPALPAINALASMAFEVPDSEAGRLGAALSGAGQVQPEEKTSQSEASGNHS
jgi:hypothetical protein